MLKTEMRKIEGQARLRALTGLVIAGFALIPAAATMAAAPTAIAASTPRTIAAGALARMSLAQRVGQLFMVGTPAIGGASASPVINAIQNYHVGNVFLSGRSSAGTAATEKVSVALRVRANATTTASVPLLIGTDQEGGYVQVLSGPGFDTMPTALTQATVSTAFLQACANIWGQQLRSAGVDVDLAPVADTVPSASYAPHNPPIGYYEREFGYTPQVVGADSVAFSRGMAAAGVAATAKHFPGLGVVWQNTDTNSNVIDTVTTRNGAYIAPFAANVNAGIPFVMVSSAIYTQIDAAHIAAFSPTVIGGMLRGDLHFQGVVISDDLGNAAAVAAWSPGDRAVNFLSAGGDMVLTVNPATVPAMYHAVLAKATSNSAFRAQVDASALRILTIKADIGLLKY
jgi:beta-N-acetylhexosaminidase